MSIAQLFSMGKSYSRCGALVLGKDPHCRFQAPLPTDQARQFVTRNAHHSSASHGLALVDFTPLSRYFSVHVIVIRLVVTDVCNNIWEAGTRDIDDVNEALFFNRSFRSGMEPRITSRKRSLGIALGNDEHRLDSRAIIGFG